MIILIAPRYDGVTARTHAVAEKTLCDILALNIDVISLFVEDATLLKILESLGGDIECVAYYGHGDHLGRLLTQERKPWCDACGSALQRKTIYAHACRAMVFLSHNGGALGLVCAMGYRIDLFQPYSADEDYWVRFNEVHAFVAREIVQKASHEEIKRRFYELCTFHLHALNKAGAGLIELITMEQARDDFEILRFDDPASNRASSAISG
jgi:hypothetical protein